MSLVKNNEEANEEQHEEPPEEPGTSNETSKKIFNVKKWDAVAMWSWDIKMDNCAICRNQNMELCIECQSSESVEARLDCPVAWGACNHAFHLHCISRWLKSRAVCPLDNKEWEYQKIGQTWEP